MFTTFFKKLSLRTNHRAHFIAITDEVHSFIQEHTIRNGLCVVQSPHTTCRLWVNEHDKNLVGINKNEHYTSDLVRILDRFASPDEQYQHDVNSGEKPNGYAHSQALMFPNALTFIMQEGEIILGQWQDIMVVELDCARDRQVTIMICGHE